MMTFTATYSPEDNKLRLYAATRLPADLYQRVRGAGFIWAPKQELFVAPMWTPERAALCEELAGDIDDEDKSLADRAEERAERFEQYSDNRRADSERAAEGVRRIADNIPLGQPILVGHHSERHARRDAARIESGMRKSVKMWETSRYWTDRAAGALRAAKYKERPEVRARRIKGLESDLRRVGKNTAANERHANAWGLATSPAMAMAVAGAFHLSREFKLADYPRDPPASQYEGPMSLWSAIKDGVIHWEEAKKIALEAVERCRPHLEAWRIHYEGRLSYEKAMLDEQGASELLAKKPPPKQLPLCNYRAPEGITIENQWNHGQMIHYPQVEMTQAEYARIPKDYKGTRVAGNSHRFRTAMQRHTLVCVFLTDAKVHKRPDDIEKKPKAAPAPRAYTPRVDDTPADVKAMRESLAGGGVKVVTARQLFPTPRSIAEQMVAAADLRPNERVLEPSVGTGNLARAIFAAAPVQLCAVEINRQLAASFQESFTSWHNSRIDVHCADFLSICRPDSYVSRLKGDAEVFGTFDCIIMNPPFERGEDIKHVSHAIDFLRPGGRIVALCADGPHQREKLKRVAEASGGYYEPLPEGSFEAQGTQVRVAMLVIWS